jgi:hypothetical protein
MTAPIPKPGDHLFNWKIITVDGRRVTARCRCHQIRVVVIEDLLSGAVTSCGCGTPSAQKLHALREAKQEQQRRKNFNWRLERGR